MVKTYDKPQLAKNVNEMLAAGNSRKQVQEHIAEFTGCKETRVKELYRELSQQKKESGLFVYDKYTYNKDSDQYIVYLKSASKDVVISGSTHRDMLKAYSNWNGSCSTINELCRNFSMPRKWFEEYRKVFGWTHDHEPISNEELVDKDVDTVVEDLLQQKRFSLYQEFQKKDWIETKKDAEKWRHYQAGVLDPFESFLKGLAVKNKAEICPYTFDVTDLNNSTVLVVGCFDWHVGQLTEARYTYGGKDWNIETAKSAIQNYTNQLLQKIDNMVVKPEKVVVLCGGDLNDGFRGHTEKLTPLTPDRIKDTQFDAIFETLTTFIGAIGAIAPKVDVHAVRGNHEGFDFYPLLTAVKAYFRTDDRLCFNISSSHTEAIRIKDVLLLLNHGAACDVKHAVPSKGKARESYIQSLLLAKPELLIGVKQKIFCQGDKHHAEDVYFETNDIEFFMFGALPYGSHYSDSLNLKSRARQNCLLIGNDGVAEVWHIYTQ